MCGRTALTASPDDLREALGLDEAPALAPRYNVPPSQPVAVLRADPATGRRSLSMLRWGLVPSWAEDPAVGARLALARAETAATTPSFRDAMARRRCLVIVDGFYEWRRAGKAPSEPFFFRPRRGRVLALAGLWERWVSRDGEVLESCAILTRAARPPVAEVHGRMPVILPKERWTDWLAPGAPDPAALADDADLAAVAVSPHVNDPRHDDPRCVEPWRSAQGSLF